MARCRADEADARPFGRLKCTQPMLDVAMTSKSLFSLEKSTHDVSDTGSSDDRRRDIGSGSCT